ncbi:hypothetical protein PLESTB_000783100 [Pleodorina starrii]|uniref:GCK domain-containing protein n=1 Tax=Pleodorina starrii TaxID=330485 RepID=A0A9W6BKG9_9CHLO|nr:hypothetical protein PLESTM_000501800 [Pleodorina starrii]GLC53749.1 hypothetical protein PLESTB_000783100 [Pleodorina starrii]GLC72929.1 hypothetical protein PLESTF_001310700 [Pleodorina starrii]
MRGGEAAPSSATTTAEAAAQEAPQADPAASEPPEAAPSTTTDSAGEEGAEGDLSQCPICQFIEAGECKVQHQTWVACRTEAKAAGKDYIEECQDHFKAFLQCAIDHRDYYEPFLEMLGGLPEDEGEEAGDQQGQGEGGQLGAQQGEGEKRQQ